MKAVHAVLVNSGVTSELGPIDVKHVQITNLLALVSAMCIGIWSLIAFGSGAPFVGLQNAVAALLYLAVLRVNRTGRHGLATTTLLLTVHAQCALSLYWFGYASETSRWYAAMIIGPYLAYPRRYRLSRHVSAGLALLAWVACTVLQRQLSVRLAMVDVYQFQLVNTVLVGLALGLAAAGFGWMVNQTEDALEVARLRADRLLLNVLPMSVAERLKDRPDEMIADRYESVTVLFADVVGFTELAAGISATQTVGLLNRIFSDFDTFCSQQGVERIKTIGDGYMAISGAPDTCSDHAEVMAGLAIRIRDYMAQDPTGQGLRVRIGLNSGSVVAGIVGHSRFHYDVWGDVVNLAARMESHGEPGRIQVGRETYERIHHRFRCESRGVIEIKGKEPMECWFVV